MSADSSVTLRVSAPVRLDLAGAWTDVAPFALEQRGAVVNAAIELRSRVEIRARPDGFRLAARDLGEELEAATIDAFPRGGRLPLLAAALRRYRPPPCALRTSAEAPPGSGLGTSGALSVALVHALTRATGATLAPREVAHEAWQLETVDAAVAGGQQDQYAAALGGFQYLVFDHGATHVEVLTIDPRVAAELARRIVVCYTGRTRFSADTIVRVMQAYRRRDRTVVAALHALAEVADRMVGALGRADFEEIGHLLSVNWREQQRLDPAMCTEEMAALDRAMIGAGALGGKAAGAGTGGSMFYVVGEDTAPAIAAARACGTTVLPARWATRGVSVD